MKSFAGGSDPSLPNGLVAYDGMLYGTSQAGGANRLGTVYSVTPSGRESILHSFTGGQSDG
jgi:uncharacterized repeat protein (TIGR03803 family)